MKISKEKIEIAASDIGYTLREEQRARVVQMVNAYCIENGISTKGKTFKRLCHETQDWLNGCR